jgi:hypothetical protein
MVVISGAAALYTHNLAIFSVIVLDLYLAFRKNWRGLGRLVLAQLAMVALFLPWLQFVPGQLQKIQTAFWTPQPGALEIVQAIVTFHASLPLTSWALVLGVSASLLAMTVTVYAVLRRLPLGWREGLLACLIVVPPVLLFVASYLMRPVFVPRAFVLSLIGYLVLAGRVIAEARPRPMGWVLAGAFVISAVIGVTAQAAHRTFPRSPFREAAAFLAVTTADGDLVLHSNKLSYFPMVVYAADLGQAFLADQPGSHNDTLAAATQQALGLKALSHFEAAAEDARRVRYVIFQRELDEYALADGDLPPALAWLVTHGSESGRTAFNDLWIYDFDLGR